jgi:cytoskeletal protein RodZ
MNNLNPTQLEQLKKIGAYLRQLRQEQAKSTEEIATKTFIPSRLLKALEEGETEQLPEPIFIQGFIRRYAEALNLDGMTLAQSFPTSFLPIKSETLVEEVPEPSFKFKQSYIQYILLGLLGVIAISGLLYLCSNLQTNKLPGQTKNSLASQQQQTAAKPAASSQATEASKLSSPIQVTVNLKDQSWLRVVADGKTQFEGVLEKGKQQTWQAKKTLTLRAGNAGAVLVSYNKEEEKPFGNLKKVKEVTFTPDK